MYSKERARKRKEKLMKKKIVALLFATTLLAGIVCGCSSTTEETSNQTSEQISMNEIDDHIQDAIQDNNKALETDILAKVDKQIQTKFNEVNNLSDQEKEELRNSIMASVREELKGNKSTETKTIVKSETIRQPITEQVSNTYNSYTTVTSSGVSTQSNDKWPKITDGTVIPVTNSLPYTFDYNQYLSYTVNEISVTAYNHENEPYREIEYPYELRIVISGTFQNKTPAPGENEPTLLLPNHIFGELTLNPYSSKFSTSSVDRNEADNTFSVSTTFTVNQLPSEITFIEYTSQN